MAQKREDKRADGRSKAGVFVPPSSFPRISVERVPGEERDYGRPLTPFVTLITCSSIPLARMARLILRFAAGLRSVFLFVVVALGFVTTIVYFNDEKTARVNEM